MADRSFAFVLDLSRRRRLGLLGGLDFAAAAAALYGAYALPSGTLAPERLLGPDAWLVAALFAALPPVFVGLRVYRVMLRYGGEVMVAALARAVTALVLVLAVAALLFAGPAFPWTVLVMLWALLLILTAGARLGLAGVSRRTLRGRSPRLPVAVWGAGHAGITLVQSMQSGPTYEPVALIDDNTRLHGRTIRGVAVYPPERVGELVESLGLQMVVVAVPSATLDERRAILRRLEPYPVGVKTVAPLSAYADRWVHVDQIREIPPEDLLWRDPVVPSTDLLARDVRGRAVLITGGGGSIGSELCRQAVRLAPRYLVILEQSEYALYQIEMELAHLADAAGVTVKVYPILGSAGDAATVERVLRDHGVETIYHAAAYKHVPLVEHNPVAGAANNVLGTLTVARAAQAAGVHKMVLISTDKAVRPANVMGASKRLAEQILQALAAEGGGTEFAMVRFGNVLDSAGSVVPRFRQQIADGGPVTVTHPDIARYFMTIPEAVQLVLQAGAMAVGGEVFVLDMGDPVRIYDLAVRMIHLAGMTVRDENNPHGDIPIDIIGLRPGEKLYEELIIGDNVHPTDHPRIQRAMEGNLSWPVLEELLQRFAEGAADANEHVVRNTLAEGVPELPTAGGPRIPQEA